MQQLPLLHTLKLESFHIYVRFPGNQTQQYPKEYINNVIRKFQKTLFKILRAKTLAGLPSSQEQS